MRAAAIVFLLCAAGPAISQDSSPADQHAFIEVVSSRTRYFVQEPIEVAVRIGVDSKFFKESVLQASRQQLDVPVGANAPWLRDLPGTTALEAPTSGSRKRLSLALNDDRADATQIEDRLAGGRRFTVVQIEKRFFATAPGPIVIPGPTLRYAYATRFEEDLVNGRVPVDRHEAGVRGLGLTLTILPLPEDGRPGGFSGAVGQFTVRAGVDRRDATAGDSLKVTFTIGGSGNLQGFDPPRLDGLAGFHVRGLIDVKGSVQRAITYDLAPVSDAVDEIPAIPFVFFDPAPPPQYRVARTEAIPITVRPRATSAPVNPAPAEVRPPSVPGNDDIFGLKETGAAGAEHAYAAGRYEEALALFQAALERSKDASGALLYDLGNSFFRLNRDADARLAYRRARLRMPRDPEVLFNLRLTERQLGVEEPDTSSFGAVLQGTLDAFTDAELARVAAALLATGIIGLALARRRRAGRIATAAVFVLGLAAAARPVRDQWFPGPREAIVIASEIGLRDEPHAGTAARIRLRAGESARIEEMSNRWALVVHARGAGWTERAGIGVVD